MSPTWGRGLEFGGSCRLNVIYGWPSMVNIRRGQLTLEKRGIMIGHCFNPECNRELRYLRQGAVYQRETGTVKDFHSEFFWLCPACNSMFDLVSDANGEPELTPSGSRGHCAGGCSRIRKVLRGVLQ